MSRSIYQPPESDLNTPAVLPVEFADHPSLSPRRLIRSAWLAGFYAMWSLLFVVAAFFEPLSPLVSWSLDALELLSCLLSMHLLWQLKLLLNCRFNFHDCDRLLYVLIYSLLPFTWLSLNMDFEVLNLQTIATMLLFVPYGVAILVFGYRLRKLDGAYGSLRWMAWLSIVIGLLTASIVLLVFAVPLAILSSFVQISIFLQAARERAQLSV